MPVKIEVCYDLTKKKERNENKKPSNNFIKFNGLAFLFIISTLINEVTSTQTLIGSRNPIKALNNKLVTTAKCVFKLQHQQIWAEGVNFEMITPFSVTFNYRTAQHYEVIEY